MFALTGEYVRVDLTGVVTRRCGGCGGELATLPDAGTIVCEACGRRLDILSGESSCQGCGSALCFPEGVSRLNCPYCNSTTQRI